jgi:pimeloyl-ACP methyl ester carboxylesterase
VNVASPRHHGVVAGDFQLQHVALHGNDVTYRRAGSGETVVLLHGLAGNSGTWRDVMPTLAETHDVIAPDLLGHGESQNLMGDYSPGAHASGLRDLLQTLEVPSATIIGHSFGGGIAMQTAYQHPELCDRLVLVASGGFGRDVSWLLRLGTLPFSEYAMPVVFTRQVAAGGNRVGERLDRLGWRSPRLREWWRSYSSLAGAENRKAFVRTIRTVMDTSGQTVSALDRLSLSAHLPTLIVWGDGDPVIPVSHAHVAHEAIPSSTLCILPGVGHFPHTEAPEQFLDAVLTFLAETGAAPVQRPDGASSSGPAA